MRWGQGWKGNAWVKRAKWRRCVEGAIITGVFVILGCTPIFLAMIQGCYGPLLPIFHVCNAVFTVIESLKASGPCYSVECVEYFFDIDLRSRGFRGCCGGRLLKLRGSILNFYLNVRGRSILIPASPQYSPFKTISSRFPGITFIHLML